MAKVRNFGVFETNQIKFKMKKIILIVFLLPFLTLAQEQSNWEIGTHLTFHNNKHSGTFKYNYNRLVDNTLFTDGGIFIQYHYTKNISFLGEMNYKTLDFYKKDAEGMIGGGSLKKEELKSSVLEIPLMARYSVDYNKWKFFANAGITLNFHLKDPEATYSYDSFEQNMPPFDTIPAYNQTENLSDYSSAFYMGYNAGLGISYHFNSKWSIIGEYRITKSFTNNFENKIPSTEFGNEFTITNFKYNANQFRLGVGYRL